MDNAGSFTATFGANDPVQQRLLPKSAIELRVRLGDLIYNNSIGCSMAAPK